MVSVDHCTRAAERRIAGAACAAPISARSLSERPWKGITFLVLDEAGVEFEDGLVYVPYRRIDGELHNRRVFGSKGRCWWETRGLELLPLGLELLSFDHAARERALLIAEGESDALALREAFAGTEAGHRFRGFDVLGLPGATSWRSEWRGFVAAYPVIYVVGDGDQAGRTLAAKVKRDVPWSRPVWLPEGEDARAILQREGPRALDPLLEQADRDARLWAAFILSPDLATYERLLRGEEVADAA